MSASKSILRKSAIYRAKQAYRLWITCGTLTDNINGFFQTNPYSWADDNGYIVYLKSNGAVSHTVDNKAWDM